MIREEFKKFEKNLNDFQDLMFNKILYNFSEKDFSWRSMNKKELLKILDRYLFSENWISIANLCFMLWENQEGDK